MAKIATPKEEKRLREGDLLISIIMASVAAVAAVLIFININVSLLIALPAAALLWLGTAWLNYNFMYEKKHVRKK